MRAAADGRIGPNAVTRVAEALALLGGEGTAERVFAAAGLLRHLVHPPQEMVPDEDVARLHGALRREFGLDRAALIGNRAGRLTADYLLAHRIPRLAQRLLALLPSRIALRLLLRVIGRHAWTFAGRGGFAWRETPGGFVLTLAGGPVGRDVRAEAPVCAYYAATFERLFRTIAGPRIAVVETACEAMGAPACEFTVLLAGSARPRAAERHPA